MDTESTLMITPSEVMEYAYCPRFIYFMNCLNIPQHEELRYKVLQGREIHRNRQQQNRGYLRKKIACVKKETDVYLASPRIRVRGIVDEVLHFADGSAAPLDYKLTEYRDYTFKTHRFQCTLYAMLIADIYRKPVKKGYICYLKGSSALKECQFTEQDFQEMEAVLGDIFTIIERGFYPKGTSFKVRCADCCYRNICV